MDQDPNQRMSSSDILKGMDKFLKQYLQGKSIAEVAYCIEKKITSQFITDFLQCKFNLQKISENQDEKVSEKDALLGRFENIVEIGSGSFAKVFKVKSKLDDQVYAI